MKDNSRTADKENSAYVIASQQNKLSYRLKKERASYVMMAPYFILFTFFTIIPVAMSMALSFTYYNMLEMPQFIGWKNYIKLFLEDDIFLISLKNTLILAVITGPVSYMLCLLFAWIINEFEGWLRAFLTLIFYAPSICGERRADRLVTDLFTCKNLERKGDPDDRRRRGVHQRAECRR